jgi:hypothetical protein
MKPTPTRTTNKIHFTDLDPIRFEDLCMNIIQRIKNWAELRHYGRKGNDNGIDIWATDENSEIWYFQCKRYSTINASDILEIISKVIEENKVPPTNLVLFTACDVSKTHHELFIEEAKKNGIFKSKIWTASVIESELYSNFHDLLFTYFGINIPKEKQNSAAKIKHGLRMKKKIEKDFIRKDIDIEYITKHVLFEPHCRFNVGEIIVRNIENDIYPEDDKINTGISSWFKSEIYNLYHNGIEIHLFHHYDVIRDKDGYWDLIQDETDERRAHYEVIRVNMVGRISYSNIIEYDFDGDNYYPMPHLYCKFNIDSMPYEGFEYYTYGDSKKGYYPLHFEKNMKRALK